jgi:hypothetical protein
MASSLESRSRVVVLAYLAIKRLQSVDGLTDEQILAALASACNALAYESTTRAGNTINEAHGFYHRGFN